VKTLFDHGSYNRNKLVIYDDDPRIEAVMANAHARHEAKVHEYGVELKQAQERLYEDVQDLVRSSELRRRKILK
jgi:hypothetical protein